MARWLCPRPSLRRLGRQANTAIGRSLSVILGRAMPRRPRTETTEQRSGDAQLGLLPGVQSERACSAAHHRPMDATVGAVELAFGRIAYRRAGSGRPLVLVHGGWADGRQWRRQLGGLADGFDVIAWDAPGSGGSFDPPESYRMPDFADALASFIRALELERPAVMGLSFGSSLVLEMERRHAGLATALVLVGAYAGWKGSLPPQEVEARLERALREADLPHAEWVAAAPAYLPGFFAGPVGPGVVDETLALMAESRPVGIRTSLQAMADADLREGLDRIAIPVLLIHGELDARSPLAVARDLHARIPGSELVVLPGIGHICNLEAPDAFNSAVRVFLSSVPQRSLT
jgi:pimeloyl-ACP methyl ester carboxylesterase